MKKEVETFERKNIFLSEKMLFSKSGQISSPGGNFRSTHDWANLWNVGPLFWTNGWPYLRNDNASLPIFHLWPTMVGKVRPSKENEVSTSLVLKVGPASRRSVGCKKTNVFCIITAPVEKSYSLGTRILPQIPNSYVPSWHISHLSYRTTWTFLTKSRPWFFTDIVTVFFYSASNLLRSTVSITLT